MSTIPNVFEDNGGRTWLPELTTPIVMNASRKLGFTLGDLLELRLNLGDLIDVLWYTCQTQAEERKVSQQDFYEIVVTLDRLPEAVACLIGVIEQAFPKQADAIKGLMNSAAPFALGKSTTLSSSADTPG